MKNERIGLWKLELNYDKFKYTYILCIILKILSVYTEATVENI